MRMEVVDEVAWCICHVCFSAFVLYGCVFVLILAHSLYIQCALFSHFLHLRTSLDTFCTLFEHYMHSSCCTTSVAHSLHTFWYTFVNSFHPYCTLIAHSLHTHCTLIAHYLCNFCIQFYTCCSLFLHSMRTLSTFL